MRSFLNLQQANGGFDAAPLMTMRYFMPNEQYATPESKVQRTEDILRRVEALPGVQAAFASNLVPLSGGGGFSERPDRGPRVSERGRSLAIGYIGVSPHMLKTLGLTVVRGRELTDTEAMTKTPYAVINQAMAKKFWPNDDPIGRALPHARTTRIGGWFTIVGIVPDYRHGELDNADPIEPCAYVSFAYGAFPNTGITIRVAGQPALISAPAREAIRASDPKHGGVPGRRRWTESEAARLLAVLPVRLDVLDVRRHRAGARRHRRLRRAVVLGRAAHAGDRRTHGARRQPRATCSSSSSSRASGSRLIGVVIGVVGSFFVTPIIRGQLVNVSPIGSRSASSACRSS